MTTRSDRLWLAAIAGLCLAVYLPTFGRGFVSEDFPTLRYLAEESVGSVAVGELTRPWLDVTLVRFYRPLASLLLRLELAVWGLAPLPFLAAHFLLHLANALMVYGLARRLVEPRSAALGGAALFALYPRSPNAVSFVAALPALAATSAILAGLLFLQAWVRAGRRSRLLATLLLSALALASYEVAVVVPALAAALVLLPAGAASEVERRRGGIAVLGLAALVGLYFVVRRAVLGSLIGGYAGTAGLSWAALSSRVGLDWSAFLIPFSSAARPTALPVIASVVMALVTVLAVARWRKGGGPWLLGVAWILIAQLPFGIWRAAPAEGRYWYLASAGLGLLLAGAASLAPASWRRRLSWVLPSLLALIYLPLLIRNVASYREAGRQADAVRTALSRRVTASPTGPPRSFVVGVPQFVPESPPWRAQVFHWGLGDAFKPPFVERELSVYPLVPRLARSLRPLLEHPGIGTVWRWSGGDLREVPALAQRSASRLETALAAGPDGDFSVRFDARSGRRYRLVVLTPLRPAFPWLDSPEGGGAVEQPFPVEFVRSIRRHYTDPIVWWVEERTGSEELVRFSVPALLESSAPPGADRP